MAEPNQTLTLESLSAIPLTTEENDTEETEGFITPSQPQAVAAEPPAPQPAPEVTPAPTAPATPPEMPEVVPAEPVDEFTGVSRDIQDTGPRPLPALFPTFLEKAKTLRPGTDYELNRRQLLNEVATNYTDGVLNDGDATKLENRKSLFMNATSVGVPKLDAQGNIVLDANNQPVMLEQFQLIGASKVDETERYNTNLIQTFEYAKNPNGAFVFFDANGQAIGGLNLAKDIQRLSTQIQDTSAGRFIYRYQDERGGNAFYLDVLKSAGVTNPAKQLYYLRQQARTGRFSGIEETRTGVSLTDLYPALANLGMMVGEFAMDKTFQIPLEMLDWYGETIGIDTDVTEAFLPALKDVYTNNRKMPYFALTAERFAEKEGVSLEEAEAVLGFTPDATQFFIRLTAESATLAPTVIKGMSTLDSATLAGFVQHVTREYGGIIKDGWEGEGVPDLMDIDMLEVSRTLEKAGINFSDAFDSYAKANSAVPRTWLEGSLERSIMAKLDSLPADKRLEYFKPQVDTLKARLDDYNEKLRGAQESLTSATTKSAREAAQKRINDLKRLRRNTLSEMDNLAGKTLTNPEVRNYLINDLGIANSVASLTYAGLYQVTEGRQDISGIGAFLSVLASINPKVRQGVGYSWENVQYAFKRGIGMEAPSPQAVALARRLQNAPPELRDKIYAFMDNTSEQIAKLSEVRYPAGHEKAGQPILTEEVLYDSFSKMSGLVTLRQLQNDVELNIQKDAGKFSSQLAELENRFEQRGREINALGEVVQNLKYIEFTDAYDPNSDAGQLLSTLKGFYQMELDMLKRDKAEFDAIMANEKPVERIFGADADAEDVEEFINGDKSIAHALAVEMARFERYGIDPSLAPVEKEKALQAHLQSIQANVADAFNRHEKYIHAPNRGKSNEDFKNFIRLHEVSAYREVNQKFNELKTKYPEDARIDVTEIHDQLVLGDYEIDEGALNLALPIYSEGSEASRAIAGLNVPASRVNQLRRLFLGPAEEYVDNLRGQSKEVTEMVDGMLSEAKLGDADAYTQMLFLREGFKNAGMSNLLPKFGISMTEYMHVVSALGKEAAAKAGKPQAIPVAQLRKKLLDDGETNFYSGFYGANPVQITGMKDDYDSVREFFKTRYLNVFKTDSASVKKLIAADGSFDDLDTESLAKFVREFKLNEPRDAAQLQPMVKMFENIIGKPVDVTTPEGRQIRSILTRLALEQIAKTAGGVTFRNLLTRIRGEDATIRPGAVKEYERAIEDLKAGRIKEAGVSINLSNFLDPQLLVDVNGKPLVNIQALDRALSFDSFKKHSEEARKAETQFFDDLEDAKKKWRTELDISTSRLSAEITARQRLVESMGATDGYLGRAILAKVGTEDGMNNIANLRADFIRQQETKGISAEDARAAFDQVVQQSTIDALFEQVTRTGDKTVFEVNGPGGKKTEVKNMVEIVPERLLELIGYRGDTVEASKKEMAVRNLLGDEVYDHLRRVGEMLYVNDATAARLKVTGVSLPLSAESQLSRATSYFRGVISLRWLVSEAAVREARRSNYELTKIMLFDPKVGKQVLEMVTDPDFKVEKFYQVYPTLISQIAKNDVLMEGAVNYYRDNVSPAVETQMENLPQANPLEDQMDSLTLSP